MGRGGVDGDWAGPSVRGVRGCLRGSVGWAGPSVCAPRARRPARARRARRPTAHSFGALISATPQPRARPGPASRGERPAHLTAPPCAPPRPSRDGDAWRDSRRCPTPGTEGRRGHRPGPRWCFGAQYARWLQPEGNSTVANDVPNSSLCTRVRNSGGRIRNSGGGTPGGRCLHCSCPRQGG